jgi:monoamine oxidase
MEEAFGALARTVDPADPWGHPDAARLDALSVGAWLREVGAPAEAMRAVEVGNLALSCDSIERTSLLAELRKAATGGGGGLYDSELWESLRVAEGSATVALRIAGDLGDRVRLATPVTALSAAASGSTVTLASGETLACGAVVSAVPVGPLRDIRIDGVSEARLASLRRQRHALAAKTAVAYPSSFWLDLGRTGLANTEYVVCGLWPQGPRGVLSGLVPPERLASFAATDPAVRRGEALEEIARVYGADPALEPDAYYERLWGLDPWTKGYITGWRPGDVMAVGPLHGTHEPPFYVCGSDQWVAGYMEGAVRTGRNAARAILSS